MKISKIKVSKFHQFENFELDLIYPKGHEKEGQPLDKVCFIGQSGTGKTTLLEIIRRACYFGGKENYSQFDGKIEFEPREGVGAYLLFQDKNEEDFHITIDAVGAGMNRTLDKPVVRSLLYFSTGLAQTDVDDDLENQIDYALIKEPRADYKANNRLDYYYPITPKTIQAIWNGFYKYIREYQNEEANFRINLTHRAEKNKVDILNEIEKWRVGNPNPLESVARDCLDVFLNKFHLAIKTEINDIKNINALQILSLTDNSVVPYEHLSTGTKQIIYTAFPIYQLLEDDSIVLMDEPETSLYPDIQREIIPYYTSLDKEKKSQFFFATHSPIIASSFEPWEIVELKFDEKGKIYRDIYYEGKNHVDNYKIDPRFLRWDDILTKVFDLPVEGNMDFRAEKLTEYATLKNKISRWRKSGELKNPTEEMKKDIEKFERAHDLITANWATTRHEKN